MVKEVTRFAELMSKALSNRSVFKRKEQVVTEPNESKTLRNDVLDTLEAFVKRCQSSHQCSSGVPGLTSSLFCG